MAEERPWTVVLLGTTGAGKSSLGNSLLEREVFGVAHGADHGTNSVICATASVPQLKIPLKVIDTPGFGDVYGRDQKHLREVVGVLEQEGFVNAFLLVLNGSSVRFDSQISDMLKAYIQAFGVSFLLSTVVVVTHWDVSEKACEERKRTNLTQQRFADSWLQKIQQNLALKCDHVIPFVFIDNRPDKEEEKFIFEEAKKNTFEYIEPMPLFACLSVHASVSVQKSIKDQALKQGRIECKKCRRYFIANYEIISCGTLVGAGVSTSQHATIAGARVARVVQATGKGWAPGIAEKAMTRGWNSNTGVHLFGKLASRVGVLIPIGVGVYRLMSADNNTERAQAAVGTGAGIAGGYGGASLGALIGSAVCPGIGTVIGGVVGGLVGSMGSQVAAEQVVQQISDEMKKDLCPICAQ